MASVKVTVNLPEETVQALKSIAQGLGTTNTEALRQLIETQYFLKGQIDQGKNLLIQDPGDKSMRQVLFNPPRRTADTA
jgi:hypothetical protein